MANRLPADKVTENDVRELMNILILAASKWYELGLQLGIQDGLLKNIRSNHRNGCEARLREMLMERLNQGEPLTWGALVEALESESVRAHEVAKRIRSQFLIRHPPVSVAQADNSGPFLTSLPLSSTSSPEYPNTPSSSSQSVDLKHQSWNVKSPNCQSQRKESPSHRSRSQRRESPSHRSWNRRREPSSRRSQSRRGESPSHRSRSWRRKSPSHRSRSWRRKSPSHRSRSWRRKSPSHRSRSQSRRRKSSSHRSRSWRRKSPSHRSQSWKRKSPSHRSRSWRRKYPSHRSRSWRRKSPSHRSRSQSRRRESPSHRSRSQSRRRESPSHRSQKRKSASSRSLSQRRGSPSCMSQRMVSPSHTSWRREFSSCRSRKREFSSRRNESPYNYPQGRKSKYQRAESHSSPSQFNVESNIHQSWKGESPNHKSGRWQSTCIQPESSPTQATSSQINIPPTSTSRPHPHPHPQPTQHSAPQPATNQTVQDSRSPLDQYIDYVKTVYKKSEVERDTRTVKWPPTPSKVYINLVSINRKMSRGQMSEYNEVTKAMVQHGDVDVVQGKKWPIDFNEIAAGDPDPSQCLEQVVLVEGAPGVGKSTFAWEFCRRWERGEIAQQYQLVLLLRLRDERMSQAKTLWDLIYHPFEVVHQAVVTHLGHSLGLNTLFILEGFDELPDACRMSDSVFLQLIHSELLPHATVMVTSRPWAVEFLISDYTNRISQHIEILGFTNGQISEYFSSVLSKNEVKDLETYIRCHPQLKGCMYIPLNTAILVTVYQESQASGFPMPTTLTELYIALVQILLLRYLKSHCLKSHTDSSIRIFNITVSLKVQGHFINLCHLAYRGIFGSHKVQLIFGESDIPEDFDNLGFMDSVTELYVTRGTVSSHNFLHLTFQEFLAAVHISNMSSEEQLTHFQRHGDGRFNVVLRFLAGLTKLGCLLSTSEEFMSPPESVGIVYNLKPDAAITADVANWMFEAQSDEINEKLIGTGLVQFNCIKSRLWQAMDYYSLGYCIVHSQCEWLLDLKSIAKEKAEMLVAGASDGPIAMAKVIGLHLNSHFGVLLEGLKDVLNLKELSLLITEKYSNIPWTTYFFSLKVLKIRAYTHNKVSEGIRQGMEDCTKAMLSNQSLERLILHGSPSFTDAAVDYLAQFIVNSNTLQYLEMDKYIFFVYGIRLLAQIIRCSSKVHEMERRRVRVIYNKNSAMAHHSDTLYPGKEPPVELVVRHHSSKTLQEIKCDDVKDLDDVLRTCPNIRHNYLY